MKIFAKDFNEEIFCPELVAPLCRRPFVSL